MSENPPGTWAGRALGAAALLGFYRLLAGSDAPAEWAAGAVAAVLAMAGVAAVSAQLPPRRMRAAWIVKVLPVVPRMAADAVRVAASASWPRVPVGTFDVVPIDPGGDDAGSAGRRALVVAAGSLAPNSLVVTLDRDQRAMLVHRLVPGGDASDPGDREWPI